MTLQKFSRITVTEAFSIVLRLFWYPTCRGLAIGSTIGLLGKNLISWQISKIYPKI